MASELLSGRFDWFFADLAVLRSDPTNDPARLDDWISGLSGADDWHETALQLFLIANCPRAAHLQPAALSKVTSAAESLSRILERDVFLAGNAPLDTWEVALLFGALQLINLYLRRDDVARCTAAAKNHVYATAISSGTLMSGADRQRLDHDLLFACVPMGLFEPEDLVLVEAATRLAAPACLAEAGPEARMMMAWYHAARGRFADARALVLSEAGGGPVRDMAMGMLKSRGQLEERFIRHQPEGHANRYAPLVEERFPKRPVADETVIVRAIAHPFSAGDPVELVLGGRVLVGRPGAGFWEFEFACPADPADCRYRLRFAAPPRAETAEFAFTPLRRRGAGAALAARQSRDGGLEISFERVTLCLRPGAAAGFRLEVEPGAAAVPAPGGPLPRRTVLGGCDISLDMTPFRLRVDRARRRLFDLGAEDLAWMETPDGEAVQTELALHSPAREVLGLGERYNTLNQYGNTVDVFVYNQYKDQGIRTYLPMPVFYTETGFGAFLEGSDFVEFDFGREAEGRIAIRQERGHLCLHVLSGGIAAQVGQYMALTGEPVMVPQWALGPWMSSNNWDSEAEVRKQVALTLEHRVPATALVIEAWSDEATYYVFNDAVYEPRAGADAPALGDFRFPEWGRWPDPKGLVDWLHANDLRCILWQIPVLKHVDSLRHLQKEADEAHAIAERHVVANADGSAHRIPEGWFKDGLVPDFTSVAARDWWFSKRRYLRDEIGVDGFKTDGGECIFGRDLRFADGSTGAEMRNRYPGDYIAAYSDFARETGGMVFSRSGFVGAQRCPAHWAGDERSTWDAMQRSLFAGLSSGLSGVIFWGWDLGGFSGPIPEADLFIRSVEMACFCPIMQYHAESKAEFNQDRTPWNIAERTGDARALSVYRFYANLRMSLIPYILREARACVAERLPQMRALALDDADDARARAIADQFRFGRDLMVAPVIERGRTGRAVYLPEGRWWHLFENRWFDPGDHVVAAGIEDIPVFARAGAVIPLAFARQMRFGGAMPSDPAAADVLALLVVGTPASPVTHREGEAAVSIAGSAEAGFEIARTGRLARKVSVVFTDSPTALRVDGRETALSFASLSGKELPCVDLE